MEERSILTRASEAEGLRLDERHVSRQGRDGKTERP